jgi:hypothetical protein
MGAEMCCSDKPEQSEISYLKPERNLILNKYNSRVKYSISPEIKFESEGLNDKDDTENNNSLNIISNDELVYGTIDSLRYKDIKQKKSYHNARNDNKISNSHTTIHNTRGRNLRVFLFFIFGTWRLNRRIFWLRCSYVLRE